MQKDRAAQKRNPKYGRNDKSGWIRSEISNGNGTGI